MFVAALVFQAVVAGCLGILWNEHARRVPVAGWHWGVCAAAVGAQGIALVAFCAWVQSGGGGV